MKIHICCGQDSYDAMKKQDDSLSASFVFLGYWYESRNPESSILSPTHTVYIEPAYFARYMSPFRDGYGQGPVLFPFRAMKKLMLRMHEKNVLIIYEELLAMFSEISETELEIVVHTQAETDSVYSFDLLVLLHKAAKSIGKNATFSLSVYTGMENHYYQFINDIRKDDAKAFLEEVEYLDNPSVLAEGKSINVGSIKYTEDEPLYSLIRYYSDGIEIERPEIKQNEENNIHCLPGWPYFRECVWNEIDYDGFVADPAVVNEIKEYERADRDGGRHLYEKNKEHWIL